METTVDVKYGQAGSIKIKDKEIDFMSKWALEQTVEVITQNFFKRAGKNKKAGTPEFKVTIDGDPNFSNGTNQKELQEIFKAGEEVKLNLLLDATTGYEGKAIITSISIENAANNETSFSISLEGTGEIQLVTA